ncbi:LysE family translocator [Paenibacillus tarimensis]|uniref:LysE family translocator n=1 Tax=Paenibacillus tarimensis TaxID=416012 RepID=UPI001F289F7A|nr:LysE family translocator [Paenibacillus tarimensis]MCF2945247.1 LysE family translocator [Paenibacillus tarimensis]
MFDAASLLFFIGTSILLIIIPGPDLIFTVTQGMTNGRKAGVVTALGLSLGNIIHTLAAVLGLSLIIQTSAVAFTIFKILGALYLFYMAFKAIKHRKEQLQPDSRTEKSRQTKGLFLRGVMMNILNPKVAIFFLTFLPQFVNYRADWVPLQMCLLGFIFIALTAVIFGLLGYFAGSFRDRLFRRPRFSEYMNIAAASIFLGLGIKLLTTKP